MREIPPVDVLVVGGGLGGCAAAIAAAESGARVLLTEESPWIGGQATSQATPPDEHPWIETRGSTALYRRFRARVRTQHARALGIAEEANPGRAWATSLGHPPIVAHHVLRGMLLDGILSGRLEVRDTLQPVAVQTDGDRIVAVEFTDADGERTVATAPWVIDATETGELLALGRVEHVTGSESQTETGEAHALTNARPDNVQPMTVTAVLSLASGPGGHRVVDRPDEYERWRDEIPAHWPSARLSWTAPDARTSAPRRFGLEFGTLPGVGVESAPDAVIDLWSYRRLIAPGAPGVEEASSINWPMNDYMGGAPYGTDGPHHVEQARQLTGALVHWLQTEAPRLDGGAGYPELRTRGDLTGTSDGLAMRPYIREGRRIRAQHTIVEQDVALADRGEHAAEQYPDSVGTGAYRIDLHPSTGGDPFIDIATRPFEIPLRALLPIRVENLLAGAKNLGTTHITNGCYRVHPVEWTIGEAAGRLAAWCVARRTTPQAVVATAQELAAFQSTLERAGVDLHWRDLDRESL